MEQKLLIVNTGSTSRKYALFANQQLKGTILCELDDGSVKISAKINEQEIHTETDQLNKCTQLVLELIQDHSLISNIDELNTVGIRIVAPGKFFQQHRLIDQNYLQQLDQALHEAPLHLGPATEEINFFKSTYPNLKLAGITDSAFHATLPNYATNYGIDSKDTNTHRIQKFGYHGISIASIISSLDNHSEILPSKIIVCHLGGGVSLTAIKDGQSIDTTMGLTPLEGLLMATRVGDIDPGALIKLGKSKNFTWEQMENYLNYDCGLKGVSGQTGDMRKILELAEQNNTSAQLALDIFIYRIQKYIGAFSATLQGLDLLVFSASIGERSSVIRQKICQKLQYLGINLDMHINEQVTGGIESIHSKTSQVKVMVVATDEMKQMAKHTLKLLN